MNEILQLMHDTMGRVASIKGAVKLLKEDKLSPEDKIKMLDAIEIKANELNGVLDAYYIKKQNN
jgi:hypothetical protein